MSLLLLFSATTGGAPTLQIQDATHGHTADNLVLTQTHVLVIQDSAHGHTADNVVLTQVHVLQIQDALHGHTADNITLLIPTDLIIQDATHGGEALTIYPKSIFIIPDEAVAVQAAGKVYLKV